MCSNCASKISVLYNKTARELMDYAEANRGSPAAAHGRLDEAVAVLRSNGGCSSCISEVESKKASIF